MLHEGMFLRRNPNFTQTFITPNDLILSYTLSNHFPFVNTLLHT